MPVVAQTSEGGAERPTVDVPAVRWLGERWGVAGRFMTGIGSRPGEHAVVERRCPWYVNRAPVPVVRK